MRSKDESGFDNHIHEICSDEVARMLRYCRTHLPEIDGRQLLGHLIWVLFQWYERDGPQQAADALERAGLYVLYGLDGFSPQEIDEALFPALQTMSDIVTTKPHQQTGPMRRTKWHRGTVVAFPPTKNRSE